ncbi:MAG TPA: hypothetical protein PKD83_10975 [Ignavibacteria bacterium]|nr:hypothetical protein [Ignavibacteria bacterium]
MHKFILIFIFSILLISCNKNTENKQNAQNQNNAQEESGNENETDSVMTDEEEFSSSLVQDILGEEDVNLQIYLEEEIFPVVSKSKKVTLDRISSSIYLLGFDDNGTSRNFMIQKLYNPETGDFIFEKTEIPTSAQKQFVK